MYTQHTVTAMTDIPLHVGNFAQALGWNTDLTDVNQPEIWHPTLVGATHFVVRAATNDLLLDRVGSSPARGTATRAPDVNNIRSTPTKVHLMGMLLPEPYIAIAIEFGFNSFRHMYIGNMEKRGNYAGGEVYSANQGIMEGSGHYSSVSYISDNSFKWLFSGAQGPWAAELRGEVHVDHVDNAEEWRRFSGLSTSNNPLGGAQGYTVYGGFGDQVMLNGYVDAGRSMFAGAVILAPIELFAVEIEGTTRKSVPLGVPSGVRMVQVKDLEPGQVVQVGGDDWKTFPAISRSSLTSTTETGNVLTAETSYYVGYAYRIS